jgi:hypothetical protein
MKTQNFNGFNASLGPTASSKKGARWMKNVPGFLFVETQLHSHRKHIDWMIVIAWASMAAALCILLAVR